MVNGLFSALIAAVLTALSGCIVQSIQPFYANESVVEFPSVAGGWRLETIGGKTAEKQERPWVFTKNEIEAYDGDNSSRISATYFKIKDAFCRCDGCPSP